MRRAAVVIACMLSAPRARAEDIIGGGYDPGPSAFDAPRPARVGPPTYELGGTAGYATPPIRGGTNPFGGGLGARLGATFGHLYVGGVFTSFQGDTDVGSTEQSVLVGGQLGYSLRAEVFEGGWFTLRPHVGAGVATITRVDPPPTAGATSGATGTRSLPLPKVDVVTQATRVASSAMPSGGSGISSTASYAANETSVANLYLDPGLTAVLSSGVFFFGLDASALVLPGIAYDGSATTWISYGFQAQLGVCW